MIQVNKPVIVLLHGFNGSLLNFEKLVPNATMYVVEGGGHMMMSTHSEEIEEVIENFFQKTVVTRIRQGGI